ncbi:hypothetical protein JCM10213v2_008619 [Rhodosporidiobolus nylandii]
MIVSPLPAPTLLISSRTVSIADADSSSIETTVLHIDEAELPASRQPPPAANALWGDKSVEYDGAGALVVANANTPEPEREWRRKMGPTPFCGPLTSFSVLKECFMDEPANTHGPDDTLSMGDGPALPPSRAPFRPVRRPSLSQMKTLSVVSYNVNRQ